MVLRYHTEVSKFYAAILVKKYILGLKNIIYVNEYVCDFVNNFTSHRFIKLVESSSSSYCKIHFYFISINLFLIFLNTEYLKKNERSICGNKKSEFHNNKKRKLRQLLYSGTYVVRLDSYFFLPLYAITNISSDGVPIPALAFLNDWSTKPYQCR